MLRWFFHRQIKGFERAWNYDAAYLHELIDVDRRALGIFGKVQALTKYRKDIPLAPYCAAGIVAVARPEAVVTLASSRAKVVER